MAEPNINTGTPDTTRIPPRFHRNTTAISNTQHKSQHRPDITKPPPPKLLDIAETPKHQNTAGHNQNTTGTLLITPWRHPPRHHWDSTGTAPGHHPPTHVSPTTRHHRPPPATPPTGTKKQLGHDGPPAKTPPVRGHRQSRKASNKQTNGRTNK